MAPSSNPLSEMDLYLAEYGQFPWDVHILIQGTLNASIQYLEAQAKIELANIEKAMEQHRNDSDYDYQEHLLTSMWTSRQ